MSKVGDTCSASNPCKTDEDGQRFICDPSNVCQKCGTQGAFCCDTSQETDRCDPAPLGSDFELGCAIKDGQQICVQCGGTEMPCCNTETSGWDPCTTEVGGSPRACGADGNCHVCGSENDPCCPVPKEGGSGCPRPSSPEIPLTCVGKDEKTNNNGTCTRCGGTITSGKLKNNNCCSTYDAGPNPNRSDFCTGDDLVCMDASTDTWDPNPNNYCTHCGDENEPCCWRPLPTSGPPDNQTLQGNHKQCSDPNLICLNDDGSYGTEEASGCNKIIGSGCTDEADCCFGLNCVWELSSKWASHYACGDSGILPDWSGNQVSDSCKPCGKHVNDKCCAGVDPNTGDRYDYCDGVDPNTGESVICQDGSKDGIRNPDNKCVACGHEGGPCCYGPPYNDMCQMSDDKQHRLNCQSDGICRKCGEYGGTCCEKDDYYTPPKGSQGVCQTLHEASGPFELKCQGPSGGPAICCKGIVDGKRLDTDPKAIAAGCCSDVREYCSEDQDCCSHNCQTYQSPDPYDPESYQKCAY